MFQKIGVTPNADDYRVINLDKGELIENCFMADDRIGIYGIFETDDQNRLVLDERTNFTSINRIYKRGNIKLVRVS